MHDQVNLLWYNILRDNFNFNFLNILICITGQL